ncbi:hypothetical protein L2E82_16086 [Cichorium intybus]|uniref:Uncharacterized protein n=1 Tax=Cichorium intybus TaxID=13427 RepID=A0ACB9F5I2_CICIN|nr:hypothetical protein L2E82_16086 [Cichorium intybus]
MPSPPFTIYACYHCPNRRTIATIGPPLSSSRSTATLLHLIEKIDVATIVDAMDCQLFCFSTTTTTPHLLKSHITTVSTIRTQCVVARHRLPPPYYFRQIANYTFINDVKLNFLDDRLVCVGYSSAGLLALMLFWDNLRKFRLGRSIEHFVLFQNFLFKLSKEDSQLKATDFGLSEFITPAVLLCHTNEPRAAQNLNFLLPMLDCSFNIYSFVNGKSQAEGLNKFIEIMWPNLDKQLKDHYIRGTVEDILLVANGSTRTLFSSPPFYKPFNFPNSNTARHTSMISSSMSIAPLMFTTAIKLQPGTRSTYNLAYDRG